MHLVFGISSLAMLVTTIWMLAADHRREWKKFQRTFREVETWTAESRIQQEDNSRYKQELEALRVAVSDAAHEIPPRELVDKFKETLIQQAQDRGVSPPSLDRLDNTHQELVAAGEKAAAATDEKEKKSDLTEVARLRERLVEELGKFVADARYRENNFLTDKKFEAAFFDVDRSQYELGVGNNLPPKQLDQIEDEVQRRKAELDKKNQLVEQAKTQRLELERKLAEITAARPAPAKRWRFRRARSSNWSRPATTGGTTSARS